MTYMVEKDGVKYTLTSKTQLDAFLSSGWKLVEETKEEKAEVSSDDKPKRKYTKRN